MSMDVKVSDLHLDYGDTKALNGISLELQADKIYGLLGRNGSGKTTLASVLAAFRKPTDGRVEIGGREPFENADVVSQICLIRESGDIYDMDKISGVLKFAANHRPHWDEDFAAKLIDRFDLPLNKRANKLSRGQRSALAVTLGLASRSPLTMFDEVHLGMDAPSRYAFYEELLADYLEHPRTIILSTHLIEEVATLFEEVVIIDSGKLVVHEAAEHLRERGVSVTGPTEAVEQFTADLTVLSTQQLGGTSRTTTFGELTQDKRAQASAEGLELGGVPLQDLFVHLTKPQGAGHVSGN